MAGVCGRLIVVQFAVRLYGIAYYGIESVIGLLNHIDTANMQAMISVFPLLC